MISEIRIQENTAKDEMLILQSIRSFTSGFAAAIWKRGS